MMKSDRIESDYLFRKMQILDQYDYGRIDYDKFEQVMTEILLSYAVNHPRKAKAEAKKMGLDIDFNNNPYK